MSIEQLQSAPPATLPRVVSSYALKMRLTQAERIAARAEAVTNPVVFDFLDLMDTKRDGINLDLPLLIAGLGALVSANVLTADRPAAIRADPILSTERP